MPAPLAPISRIRTFERVDGDLHEVPDDRDIFSRGEDNALFNKRAEDER